MLCVGAASPVRYPLSWSPASRRWILSSTACWKASENSALSFCALLKCSWAFVGCPLLQLDAAEHQVDLGDPGVEPASAPHQRLRFVQPAVLEGFERLLGQVVGVARLLVEGARLHPRGVAGALGEPG